MVTEFEKFITSWYGNPDSTRMHNILYRVSLNSDLSNKFMKTLREHIQQGERVYVEYINSARKGTIGYLDLTVENIDRIFRTDHVRKHFCDRYLSWTDGPINIKFDGRQNTITAFDGVKNYLCGDLDKLEFRFNVACNWVYTTKARPKVAPVEVFDNFGMPLTVGQTVIAVKSNTSDITIGDITRISNKGSVWFKPFKDVNESMVSNKGIIAVTDDMVQRALIHKLSN